MLPLFVAALLASAPPGGAKVEWPPNEVKQLLVRIPQTEGAPTVEAKDSALADIVGIAYRVPRLPQEPTEAYAKRMLLAREPSHPNVKKGQWLSALMRLFYEDLAKRTDTLARFERDRKDRVFFEQRSREAKQLADYLAGTLEVVVEGMEGFLAPLPIADPGEPPQKIGCEASVRGGVIVVENLERIRFEGDQPPTNAIRTSKGALKELFSAQRQYNISANMLGMYEQIWRKNKGNLRVIIPAASPAIYLNELVLGAREAEMTTIHVMCMSKKGELRELALALSPPKPPKAKGKGKGKKALPVAKTVEVSCPSTASMQRCVDKIQAAKAEGTVVYVLQ